jgi:glycosyltransferase involved in cell wall biosynthesis
VARSNGAALRVDPARVHIAERGRNPQLPASAARVDELRRSLRLPPDHKVVLAVGRQEAQKNHVKLVEQMERVCAAFPATLLIAGREGSATAPLRASIERSTADVRLLGPRDDVWDLLALADVFVLSSTHEGAAGSVLEAMGAGTPIVMTRLLGTAGVIRDGESGREVEPDGLGRAIIEVLGHPEIGRRYADAAREEFDHRFTIEVSANRLADIYRTLASKE